MSLVSIEVKLPQFNEDLSDEIHSIGLEANGGRALAESAILRIARVVLEKKYEAKTITDEVSGGTVTFVHQEDFVVYVCRMFNVSRATVMERISTYRELIHGLDMSYDEVFRIMLSSPGAPKKLSSILQFDRDGNIKEIDTAKCLGLPSNDPGYAERLGVLVAEGRQTEAADLIKPAVRELLQNASDLDNRSEASKLMDETLGKNSIVFYPRIDGGLRINCVERAVNQAGEVIVVSTTDYHLTPDRALPTWAIEKMVNKLGAAKKWASNFE